MFQCGIIAMSSPVDTYLQQFHGLALRKLQEMRTILQLALPEAEECISYGMPAYRISKIVVYFAGNAHHIGLYPTPSAIRAFEHELMEWKYSKGAIQFPYERTLPSDLITRIAVMRKKEVEQSETSRCALQSNPGKAHAYERALLNMDAILRESGLAKPALRALIDHDIYTIAALKQFDESALQEMHGIGPKALNIIINLQNN